MSRSFVFWQNIISIHQTAFLETLSVKCKVTLIVESPLSPDRAESGWRIPEMVNVEIISSPSKEEIDQLLEIHQNAVHVFSGIDAYPLVFHAFRKAVNKRMRIFIYAEPYDSTGIKGLLKHLKYRFLNFKYGHRISAFLATGKLGRKCYTRAGFKHVFEWGYFTKNRQSLPETGRKNAHSQKPVLLYIGQFIKRKKIVEFLKTAVHLTDLFEHFYLVGQGNLLQKVENTVAKASNMTCLGVIPNEELPEIMSHCDILILPSAFDGWGAVVNEALQCGIRVICSDACGAATLLDHQSRGGTFSWNAPQEPEKTLLRWLEKGNVTEKERKEIALWARTHISGDAACGYFLEICEYVNGDRVDIPQTPWKTAPTGK